MGRSNPATQAAYYQKNKARIEAKNKAKRAAETPEQREARLKYLRDRYRNNKESYLEAQAKRRRDNLEEIRALDRGYSKKYRAANSDKRRSLTQNRRARMKSAPGTHTAQDIVDLFEDQLGLCCYCGDKLEPGYHVDHFVPLSRGGTNGTENIVIACETCNTSKGAKLFLIEWLPQLTS